MGEDWSPPTEAELKVIEARRERNDKISSIMGGYLLRGYKMLGQTCDICDTIILETRQGVRYCVACQEVDVHETSKDDPVMNEQAARRLCQEHSTPTAEFYPGSPAQANATQSSTPARPEVSAQQTGGTSVNDDSGQTSNRLPGLDPTSAAGTRAISSPYDASATGISEPSGHATPAGDMACLTGLTSPTPSSTTCTRDPRDATPLRLSGTADALTAKIQWATKEMETETRDLTRCRLLAQLIRDCSEALTTVNKVQWPGGGDC